MTELKEKLPLETRTREVTSTCVHETSPTPHLDHEFQQPQSKQILQAVIAALSDIADEHRCTTCAVETSSRLLTGYLREVREAKKSGKWSKEERKAMKKETKMLASVMKRDVGGLWREN
ncbi:hypothetical protein BDV25DRAFT_135956 [Aspergillus avenaceus]|uniref:Uncharacterized protein n=1 Tax=Aspergillus avenaceus TaxID=36643 RepID=A0A5N6U6N5_ASPAV|nr:hypothetical protein BDV25DRAFT_135956 [Aspergillus avenaceus]